MGVLTDTMQKNNRDIINEVEKITKTIEKAHETEKANETLNNNQKHLLRVALSEYITDYYEKNKGGFVGSKLDELKQHFKILDNRNKIIKELGQNHLEYEYLDKIFNTTLNKIDRLQKEDYKARLEQLTDTERAQVFIGNVRLEHPSWTDEDILNFATLPMHRKPNPRNKQRDKKPRGLVIFNQYNIRLI